MSVGYDHIDVEAVKSRKIALGYTPDVLTDATADLTVLLALGASRRIKESIRAAEDGQVKKKQMEKKIKFLKIPFFYLFFSGENGLLLGYVVLNSLIKHLELLA